MKVAIVGSRDFNDRSKFEEFIREICQENGYVIDTVISGGARGADHLAEEYAREHNLSLKVFPADWDKYGKSAGFRRNADIISNCDVCFAFWMVSLMALSMTSSYVRRWISLATYADI